MKLKLLALLCCMAVLGGCSFFDDPIELVVTAERLAAHPPATIGIRADLLSGWHFVFETGERTFEPGTNEQDITFYVLPAVVTVTASKAGEVDRIGELFIDLINSPVNMDDRPFVASYGHIQGSLLPNEFKSPLSPLHASPSGDHFLSPLSYEVFFCERKEGMVLYPGFIPINWGFYDPDGDDWWIVDVVAWYAEAGQNDADAVFASVPYRGEGIYEVMRHDDAFLIIPTWPKIIDTATHLYKAPPAGVPGYPGVCYEYACSVGPYPEQDYFVRITTEDSLGATNTKTFKYRLLPTGC